MTAAKGEVRRLSFISSPVANKIKFELSAELQKKNTTKNTRITKTRTRGINYKFYWFK